VPEQSLQPPAQEDERMKPRTLGEKNLFDLGGGNTLSVIADAHLNPRSGRTNLEAELPGLRRGMESMLDRIFDQGLQREGWHEYFQQARIDHLLHLQSVT
jgi:hypothetical protein